MTYAKKSLRITKQLQELCAILCGLVVASDFKVGQALIADKEFKQCAGFFQEVFEACAPLSLCVRSVFDLCSTKFGYCGTAMLRYCGTAILR